MKRKPRTRRRAGGRKSSIPCRKEGLGHRASENHQARRTWSVIHLAPSFEEQWDIFRHVVTLLAGGDERPSRLCAQPAPSPMPERETRLLTVTVDSEDRDATWKQRVGIYVEGFDVGKGDTRYDRTNVEEVAEAFAADVSDDLDWSGPRYNNIAPTQEALFIRSTDTENGGRELTDSME